jgi:uncharacterized membrane protein YdjX (TVP38/TMEM64 family)
LNDLTRKVDEASRFIDRIAGGVRVILALVILVCLLLIMRQLPVEQGIAALRGWIEGLGLLGPIVYGAIYVVASLFLVPGLILTITAGALFGLLGGGLTVSVASTTAAGLALLISRYLARKRIEQLAQNNTKFRAMDAAVTQGGWKIVAMLRLSPAVPFNLQNYFYGLTRIRFWPCVLTSWIAMMPGTFLYVYVGHLGAESIEAAAADNASLNVGKWVLLGVGLLATVGVTVYITKLAKKALAEHSKEEVDVVEKQSQEKQDEPSRSRAGWTRRTSAALVLTVLMVVAVCVAPNIKKLFGPPQVEGKEKFTGQQGSEIFDHSEFDALLGKHVTAAGFVNYGALKQDEGQLAVYIKAIGEAPLDKLGRDEKLALLINAYNAFTLQLILDFDIPSSIKDIPSSKRWSHVRWNVGGTLLSLQQIENEHLRKDFVEPRIHFAINCASVGCPPLRREAYVASRLDAQLAAATAQVHVDGSRWYRFDANVNAVYLTKIYDWYRGDFERKDVKDGGGLIDYVAKHASQVQTAMAGGKSIGIRWLDYDWSLNDSQ